MAFTTNQVAEMAARLKAYGVKDSQFTLADSVGDEDIVAIVQDGANMAVTAEGLAAYVAEKTGQTIYESIADDEIDAVIDGTEV